jgi:hypothetical protein
VRDNVFVDNETLLVTDFVKLKIKPTQCFRCIHRDKIYIHIFIGVSAYTYINIYVYIMFVKNSIASGGCSGLSNYAVNSQINARKCPKRLLQ